MKKHKNYSDANQQLYSQDFVAKYIKYAKRIQPKLSEEAVGYLSKKWTALR